MSGPVYVVESLARRPLPPALARASEDDVEDVLRTAVEHLGLGAYGDVRIDRVSSVVGGSCIACVDVVASVGGTPMLVARPDVF